jgi:putative ABC transport system permease protein
VQYLIVFQRLILRPMRAEPVRTLLTLLSVALGVAVVLAIEMAGEAAAGSFQSSVESLTGKADFEITATGGVPAEALTTVATLPFPFKIRPRIEDYAVVAESGETVPLIGIDVLSDASLKGATEESVKNAKSSPAFDRRDAIWAGRKLGWTIGERVELLINDRPAEFRVLGLLPDAAGTVIAMDLAAATSALRRSGTLDRVLVEIPPNANATLLEAELRNALGAGFIVAPFGARTGENRRMLAAFRWNLRVLSYIALIVGAFLIYNTISVSVVRRRAEIGILRALGATRGGVLLAFLGEAACFGLLGAAVGVALGRILAESAVQLVAVTVESLYVSSRPGAIELTWPVALIGLSIGLSIALLSAFAPAWEASRVPPVEAMSRSRREHTVRLHTGRNLMAAMILALLAAVASQMKAIGGTPLFGYLAALCLIGALAASIAPLVAGFSSFTAGAMRRMFGAEGLLATRSLAGSLRRTSVLVAALATAIAMTAAVGIMVGSFRQTVLLWMHERLQADLYIRPAGRVSADRHPTMTPDSADRLRSLPEVEAVDTFRAYEISYNGKPATLGAGEARIAAKHSARSFTSSRDPREIFQRMTSGDDAVIVSEPFANKHNVRAGDTLTLQLSGRSARFEVLDIYYDYASEHGYIIMDRSTMLRYLPDPSPSNMAVYLKTGVDLEHGRRAVESALAGRKLLILTNRTLREEAIRTFDRTFAVTYALEAVAVFVAIMGVAGALLALVIDRRREFGLLRFLGGAKEQLHRLILLEAGLLGLLANIAGVIVGVLLSLLLIFVINKQSFGWTIQFHWPVAVLLGALSLVFLATVASALYPARVATRLDPIEVIHEE